MINFNNLPDAADCDAAYLDDSASPKYLIDSKIKRKIDPRSKIIQNKIKNTVTDIDAEDKNASHDTMNTSPHAPNAATAPDA